MCCASSGLQKTQTFTRQEIGDTQRVLLERGGKSEASVVAYLKHEDNEYRAVYEMNPDVEIGNIVKPSPDSFSCFQFSTISTNKSGKLSLRPLISSEMPTRCI